jgi:hypothetical protein
MIKEKIYLFGVYPVNNPYFMSNSITYNLRFIVGPFWGIINRHNKNLKLTIDEKEDVERTILYYREDKKILRYNNISFKTSYYIEKGGMQTENKDRKEESFKSSIYLSLKYPYYCHLKPKKKKSGFTEVILHKNI